MANKTALFPPFCMQFGRGDLLGEVYGPMGLGKLQVGIYFLLVQIKILPQHNNDRTCNITILKNPNDIYEPVWCSG